ncbi:expressed unknown protein [Seminavis robusta]|uniref:Uncharacterized protein n=1 Tax=Seminavis robusta TaxID=568900 RepID=A0A9N8HSY2_9STRA|nr:expressed unknown protein [Seminavis robusta]|eukprot:Sro1792_g297850.1 n/a (88) ;mRNA; r:10770-11107
MRQSVAARQLNTTREHDHNLLYSSCGNYVGRYGDARDMRFHRRPALNPPGSVRRYRTCFPSTRLFESDPLSVAQLLGPIHEQERSPD